MEFDLVVIGGGAAGLGAARAARPRAASVALVERARIGGDCTFAGCIPSKSLLEAARRSWSFPDAVAHMRAVVERVAAREDASVLRREGIEVLEGEARFVPGGSLVVDGVRVQGRAYVLATGGAPAVPAIPGLDEVGYLTSETLFQLDAAPASLAVIGGGPVGVEMAFAFASFGVEVALFEAASRLLPTEEPLASVIVHEALTYRGVNVCTSARIDRVEPAGDGGGARVMFDGTDSVQVERVLVAVGRRACTSGLGLEVAGVQLDSGGFVVVDRRMRTSARKVFAAGDVTGPPQFTHVAYQTGRVAALNALSRVPVRSFSRCAVPHVIFTDPEVGRVGLTESEAVARGARVAFLPMGEVDRAIVADRTDGFVKLIAAPRRVLGDAGGGRLVGATVVGPRAGEMLQELALAVRLGLFVGQLASTTHAYPTWSLAVQQAAAQFFGVFDGRWARRASAAGAEGDDLGRCYPKPSVN